MSVTINGLTITRLTAQPFGYTSDDVSKGRAARSWTVSGLLDQSELAQFVSIFNTWSAARRADPDPVGADDIGSTVALSCSANGLTASGVACWFSEAPQIEQVGRYVQLTATLVDAAQSLEITKTALEQEAKAEEALKPDLGTVTLGGVVITLTEPMETLDDLPTLERTAGGFAYIQGPLRASAVRDITGTVENEAAYVTLRNWVASTVQTTPQAGAWWPTRPPTASVEAKMIDGVKTDVWTVSLTVEQV
ncbi:hypothetical protein EBT31_05795 [bacterium]|jgi:hypothetical protein|nr:hypothetical protein [bacterium]